MRPYLALYICVAAFYVAIACGILRAEPTKDSKPIDTCRQLITAVDSYDWGILYDISTEEERIKMVADAFVRLGGRYHSDPEIFDPILLKYYDRKAASEALNNLSPESTNLERLKAIVSTIRNPREFVKEHNDDAVQSAKLRGKIMPVYDVVIEKLNITITGDTALAVHGDTNIPLKYEAGEWRISGVWNLQRRQLEEEAQQAAPRNR